MSPWKMRSFAARAGLAALLALFVLGAHSAGGATLAGRVTQVIDGDSLRLTPDGSDAAVEVRLLGIDAPEICQAWGLQARQALSEQLLGKPVSLKTNGLDTYGRTLATVHLDTLNVNRWMVQEGHAWSTRTKWDRGPYVADERMAKALSRGLNREGGAIMPREFRRSHGPCSQEDVAGARTAGGVAKAPVALAPVAAVAADGRRCDGRTRCSQMTSCAEATWFLKNCPGVQMDGNDDGVPCERQWCKP
jgi:endonuclease YncB( thermonuclease family)